MTTVAVVGLGYVGLPLAIEFGKKYARSASTSEGSSLIASTPIYGR
jgi:hypothetical protein